MQRRLAAIFCADIVGYSRLVGMDEAGTFQRVRALRREILQPLVAEHGGRIVSYAGDGALAEFPSVIRAVECALTVQRAVAEREPEVSLDWRISLRIGIHLGDIIADVGGDLCGDAVNIAARLEQVANPGGICLSDRAHEALAGQVQAAFQYGGEPPLKNIGHRVGVWFWDLDSESGRVLHPGPAADPVSFDRQSRLGQSASWPEIFENVPTRDLNFIGREDALASLHRLLMRSEWPTAITQAAIHGLGGIGKTTLAAEYAHRHAHEYAGVWWAPAENRTVLLASLVTMAGRLEPRLAQQADQERAAQAGLAHLARLDLPYLLIYDNVTEPDTVRNLVPTGGARVVLTTRWADWSGRATELELDVLGSEAAVKFLQKRAGRTHYFGAARLAKALGYLPLALDHAGAYCRLSGLNFDDYRKKIDGLIEYAPRGVAYPESVAATIGLAIQNAARECSAAEELVGLCAYLAPERIPLDLIAGETADEDERAKALMSLAAVSLVEHTELNDGEPAVTLHRLVQAAMRARLAERGETRTVTERVIRRLAQVFPTNAYKDTSVWPLCAVLLPHVLALRDQLHPDSGSPVLAGLYEAAAGYLHRRGDYAGAMALFEEALAVNEKTLGREHPALATTLSKLARLYRFTGRNREAEPLLKEALATNEKTLGREHSDVAFSLINLAQLYHDTGRYAEAEPLYKEALAIFERSDGDDPATIAFSLGNLARLYLDTSRYAEAEPLYKEALAVNVKTLGREHSEVVFSLGSLARLYKETNRYAEAEPLLKEALSISEKTLGREHPNVGFFLGNLARLHCDTGHHAEAEPLFKEALSISERTLGPEHPNFAASLGSLGRLYLETGRYAEAEPLLEKALAINVKTLGREHPNVAASLGSLGRLFCDTGRIAEAEPLLEEALAVAERTLGHGHPGTAHMQRNLANLLLALGRSEKALQLAEAALSIHEKVLGANHQWTADTAETCAAALKALGQSAEASSLLAHFGLPLSGGKLG